MNQNPRWKNVLVGLVMLVGIVIVLPNLYGEDEALQIGRNDGTEIGADQARDIESRLAGTAAGGGTMETKEGRLIVRLASSVDQITVGDQVRAALGDDYNVALTYAPRTPAWLAWTGVQPISLGLDLRGGVHFLFQVDMDKALAQYRERYAADFSKLLRDERIRRSVRIDGERIVVELPDAADAERAEDVLREFDNRIDLATESRDEGAAIVARITEAQIVERQNFAIEQNTVTLRNRVSELGVSEPIVQRQGVDRIVVQLPGVKDPNQAERVLGATATLEFRLVCDQGNPVEAERTGRAPVGCELYKDRGGQPLLLKRRLIVTGDQLVDAAQTFDQGQPAVSVRLDAKGGREMLDVTKANLNKPMAVVFVEQKREKVVRDGKSVEVPREKKEVISTAVIRGVFSSQFQITGLDVNEARDLALLLRAGALAAPVYKIEERTVGPSLGRDNIEKGQDALVLGLVLVAIFMAIYYRGFGLVANLALLANVILLGALVSLLQASLSLPGIAGVVLTIGMAVDANVLVNERIREELRNGNSPQAAIHAGYDKAFATILDSNVTTLIAGLVLFAFGTGPIKGFAVVLCLGIFTSVFTAVVVSRSLVNAIWGGRRLESLPV
ncbi:MAG: protein translocase subunit SecD [Gammaproteobacteria bacterium]|nr:protein translocase subunit SecD [Gammaproteobacteria bacterium]